MAASTSKGSPGIPRATACCLASAARDAIVTPWSCGCRIRTGCSTAVRSPSLLAPIELDLDGEGVRDVTYSSALGSFVIVAGTWRRGKHTATTLWSWDGQTGQPVKLRAPDFEDLNPEGITEVLAQGSRALLIVSDDGNADELFARGRALEQKAVSSRYAILPLSGIARASQ